jgi:hypothetical protein
MSVMVNSPIPGCPSIDREQTAGRKLAPETVGHTRER